ncbi:MAG: hypothetical protein WEA61_01910 [Anaerolineales bacterium]
MRVSYRPTFDQFADNYLATYYSGGVRVLQRAAGGPLLIMLGALSMVWVNTWVNFWLLRFPLLMVGLVVALYGLSLTLRPLFNLFLVWLRRRELFEGENAFTAIELKGEFLDVSQGKENLKLPLSQIQSVQHRSTNTWILTHSDSMIYVPREGLLSGSHDEFVGALEDKLMPKEEQTT